MDQTKLKKKLDYYVEKYNQVSFIEQDPISIPHQFTDQKNIEIMGFWVAMLSWGQRKTIINKTKELIQLMDGNPYDFIMNHQESDLKKLIDFKHRTFNFTDTLYFIEYFKSYFSRQESLEQAFLSPAEPQSMKANLIHFHEQFFSLEFAPHRTRKHVSTPLRKSACKRLNMFLRWMVRKDDKGVDFGIWKRLQPNQLMIPLDVHVFKIAKQLGLLKRDKADWSAVEELTESLKVFDEQDPVKYDFALFSLGILNEPI